MNPGVIIGLVVVLFLAGAFVAHFTKDLSEDQQEQVEENAFDIIDELTRFFDRVNVKMAETIRDLLCLISRQCEAQ